MKHGFSMIAYPADISHMVLTSIPRSRFKLGVGILAVIALGLASRKYSAVFPLFLGKYPGDALWALMVFLGWAFVKPSAPTSQLAFLALVSSYAVEFSQLYQAPWINAIRITTAGHLVLGSKFSWLDICSYTIGVAIGVYLDIKLAGAGGFSASKHQLLT